MIRIMMLWLGFCVPLVLGNPREITIPKDRLSPSGMSGTLILAGGPLTESEIKLFEPKNNETVNVGILIFGKGDGEELKKAFSSYKGSRIHLWKIPDSKNAEKLLTEETFKTSNFLVISIAENEDKAQILKELSNSQIIQCLTEYREKGNAILSVGAINPLCGEYVITKEGPVQGWGLATGMIIDEEIQPTTLEKYQGYVGINIPKGATLGFHGRVVLSLGQKNPKIVFAKSKDREAKIIEIKKETQQDYNEIRRIALSRANPNPYPPKIVPEPEVKKGSLIIVGGGALPDEISKKFVELGGGAEGHFVVLPISMPDPIPPENLVFLKKHGAKNISVISARELKDVEDPKNIEILKKATAIWFGGGRQWRFIDAYEGTKVEKLFHEVLNRGGVIGGSSAGATIQGDYLVRGSPAGPHIMMCEGYEKSLAFLPGVAIDQHFSQRKRHADMTALMKVYPQFLGIGLDEATAIFVQGSTAEVMGRGEVFFYDRRKPLEVGKPDYESLKAGGKYDLKARKIIELSNSDNPPKKPQDNPQPKSPENKEPSKKKPTTENLKSLLDILPARNIGPANMGGRITDIAVDESNPKNIYIAAANGGVWKSTDGGDQWTPIFDEQETLNIGAIALAPSDPNIIYVGTGEANPRNSVTSGRGVYKSIDGGKSWQYLGLKESHHIGRIVVDPKDANVVYVAALGHLWGFNKERGIYKSIDGGKTWQQSKYLDEKTGFIDLAIDPEDPKILYACSYPVQRDLFSGGSPKIQSGPLGGLYQTIDAGKTWQKLEKGLPNGAYGRCGISIYKKNPNIVYAVIQTDKTSGLSDNVGQVQKPNEGDIEKGGIFRSEDRGKSWKKLNDLVPRPFYYGQIRIDPNDDKRIYVLGVAFHVSNDGGKTFSNAPTGMHPDHHAMWINPKDSNHAIVGNDGGLYITKDRGKTWTAKRGLCISQFYGVAVDTRTAYKVYGGLQDNGSWGGETVTDKNLGITLSDWFRILGADGFQAAVDPTDPNTVYAESQYGGLSRINLVGPKGPTAKRIKPVTPKGEPAKRFNWNSPILLSIHDPKTIYFGGNVVFKSVDRGDNWTIISPDLTGYKSGNPPSAHTITALAESPKDAKVLYAGCDDGQLHVTKDGGKSWINLTDKIQGLPLDRHINKIECDPFEVGTVYVVINRYRNDDLKPYLYQSTDYGSTWQLLTKGLPEDNPLHCVKISTRNPQVFFLGSERGLYVSVNAGREWVKMTHKLPPALPVHDLVIHPHQRDLIIGTHGRGIYIVEIGPIEELAQSLNRDAYLFQPRTTLVYSIRNLESTNPSAYRGENPPYGLFIRYQINNVIKSSPVYIVVENQDKKVVTEWKIEPKQGLNQLSWDLTVGPEKKRIDVGEYRLIMDYGNVKQIQPLKIESLPKRELEKE